MKNTYFPDFSCTHGRMCVYGRYAPGNFPKTVTNHFTSHSSEEIAWSSHTLVTKKSTRDDTTF